MKVTVWSPEGWLGRYQKRACCLGKLALEPGHRFGPPAVGSGDTAAQIGDADRLPGVQLGRHIRQAVADPAFLGQLGVMIVGGTVCGPGSQEHGESESPEGASIHLVGCLL